MTILEHEEADKNIFELHLKLLLVLQLNFQQGPRHIGGPGCISRSSCLRVCL